MFQLYHLYSFTLLNWGRFCFTQSLVPADLDFHWRLWYFFYLLAAITRERIVLIKPRWRLERRFVIDGVDRGSVVEALLPARVQLFLLHPWRTLFYLSGHQHHRSFLLFKIWYFCWWQYRFNFLILCFNQFYWFDEINEIIIYSSLIGRLGIAWFESWVPGLAVNAALEQILVRLG